jgi:hypothetical protein
MAVVPPAEMALDFPAVIYRFRSHTILSP